MTTARPISHSGTACVHSPGHITRSAPVDRRIPPCHHTIRRQQNHSKTHEPPTEKPSHGQPHPPRPPIHIKTGKPNTAGPRSVSHTVTATWSPHDSNQFHDPAPWTAVSTPPRRHRPVLPLAHLRRHLHASSSGNCHPGSADPTPDRPNDTCDKKACQRLFPSHR